MCDCVVEWNDSIYVLYSEGRTPNYDTFPNRWSPGTPESDPGIVPPPGFYQPVRGFGLAWLTTNDYQQVVRE